MSVPRGGSTASGVMDRQTWVEEPVTRDVFYKLLSVRRLVSDATAQRPPRLFEESVLAAEEVTETLGTQVYSVAELIVSALSDAPPDAAECGAPANRGSARSTNPGNNMGGEMGSGPPDVEPREVYGAAITITTHRVFLLFAEECGLLPTDTLYTGGCGMATILDALEARARDEGEEPMDGISLI